MSARPSNRLSERLPGQPSDGGGAVRIEHGERFELAIPRKHNRVRSHPATSGGWPLVDRRGSHAAVTGAGVGSRSVRFATAEADLPSFLGRASRCQRHESLQRAGSASLSVGSGISSGAPSREGPADRA
jgi:hypothetical protein